MPSSLTHVQYFHVCFSGSVSHSVGIVGIEHMAEMKGTWTDTARCEGLTMGMKPQLDTFQVHAFFFISNTFISNTRLKMEKS